MLSSKKTKLELLLNLIWGISPLFGKERCLSMVIDRLLQRQGATKFLMDVKRV